MKEYFFQGELYLLEPLLLLEVCYNSIKGQKSVVFFLNMLLRRLFVCQAFLGCTEEFKTGSLFSGHDKFLNFENAIRGLLVKRGMQLEIPFHFISYFYQGGLRNCYFYTSTCTCESTWHCCIVL